MPKSIPALEADDTPVDDTDGGPQEILPQTGIAWWPAGLLAALGIGLAATGLWVDRKRTHSTGRRQSKR
jgi:LPXTG-motif cell wall-anchored protein